MGYRPNRIGSAVAPDLNATIVELPNGTVSETTGAIAGLRGLDMSQDLNLLIADMGGAFEIYHDDVDQFTALTEGKMFGFGVKIDETDTQENPTQNYLCNINASCIVWHTGNVTIFPFITRIDPVRSSVYTGVTTAKYYRSVNPERRTIPYNLFSPIVGFQHITIRETIILTSHCLLYTSPSPRD